MYRLVGQMHAAIVRTLRWQRYVVSLIDLVRKGTAFVLPIHVPRLASRRLPIRIRRPLRERPRLPLLLQWGLGRRDLLSLRLDSLRRLDHRLKQLP